LTYLVARGILVKYFCGVSVVMERTNSAFMSGVPEFLVLRLLAREPMYGYELVKSIRLVSGEAITLGEGVVYPVLHSLERNGSLRAKRKVFKGRTRVYYHLTPKGQRRLDRLSGEWERISSGVRTVLKEVPNA
jgi:PadR family transcriptional regulator PadR